MKASYHMKVNGVWYAAGEEIPEENPVKAEETATAATEEAPAEKTEEPKTRSTRRKKISE